MVCQDAHVKRSKLIAWTTFSCSFMHIFSYSLIRIYAASYITKLYVSEVCYELPSCNIIISKWLERCTLQLQFYLKREVEVWYWFVAMNNVVDH